MNIAHLIQQKIPLGRQACFTLKSGDRKTGVLAELSKNHIIIENNGDLSVILLDMIGAFDVSELSEPISISPQKTDSDNLSETASKLCYEIETRFNVKSAKTPLEVFVPDFNVALESKQYPTDFFKIWDRIKNRYEHAKKINELSSKYGRIQPIIADIKSLSDKAPDAAFFKKYLGYLYFLSHNIKEAFACLKAAAFISNAPSDWYNFAVLSFHNEQKEHAFLGLNKYFAYKNITDNIIAWHEYAKLLQEFKYYSSIMNLLENRPIKLSEEDNHILLETCIYLLLKDEKQLIAEGIAKKQLSQQGSISELISDSVKYLNDMIPESFASVLNEYAQFEKNKQPAIEISQTNHSEGIIQNFIREKNFGFIYDKKGEKYFFHKTAVIDDDLLKKLNNFTFGTNIQIVFEPSSGPHDKFPVATQVSQRYSPEDMFKQAKYYANEGEYAKAITHIKRLLIIAPNYPNAQEYLNKWKEYAQLIAVPKGSNHYARAKRAQLIEKDLERAAELFKESIKHSDNLESAVKDLAMLYVQMDKNQEALDVLTQNKKYLQNQQSLEGLFVTIYQKTGRYRDAVNLLQAKLKLASKKDTKEQLLLQIGNLYLKAKDYKNADENFKNVLKINPENIVAQRNLAVCLSQQGNYSAAKEQLETLIVKYSDGKAAEILEAIKKAQITGEPSKIEEIIIESGISDFSGELSDSALFFLSSCEFENTNREKIKDSKYIGSEKDADREVKRLEALATEHGTRRPHGRSQCYMESAKIILDVDGDRTLFYRYLCRSFASKGDASVLENKHLDTIREYYAESLRAYDGCSYKDSQFYEQDAINALARFLWSMISRSEIPMTPPKRTSDDKEEIRKEQLLYIDRAIEKVIQSHLSHEKIFNAILSITLTSRFAYQRLVNSIYSKLTLQPFALEYLKNKGISLTKPVNKLDDFLILWNELRRRKTDELRVLRDELKLLNTFELTTAWLSGSIQRVNNINSTLLNDLNIERIRQIKMILENCLHLCTQISFEEQELLCIQINNRCDELISDVKANPTQMSIEHILKLIEIIKEKIKNKLAALYETSKPQIELILPIESYVPDNNQQIDVQITVSNKIGRSPAESIELIIQPDEDYYSLLTAEISMKESLSGDKQKTLMIPVRVTNLAIQEQTFSLPVYVQYRTRSDEIQQTPVNSFSIRLYPEDEFEEIENPYAIYAESGVVIDPAMFYGRKELINNIAEAIEKAHKQGKSIIVYGQKRAGKSSILYHLKIQLQSNDKVLVLDLGNIGSILDENSKIPLLYQILWSILSKLKNSIEDFLDSNSYNPLDLDFPDDITFYQHPAPLSFFKDVFDKFKKLQIKDDRWKDIRIVLLIDEFSYLYGPIITGKLADTFMKNWKALLQENYFSCVLAGQDVMPKFKQMFPNEFGTTQDEIVTYLKKDDAIKLIDEPIRIRRGKGESRYRGKAIQRIFDLTAGSPFYIQILCNRLVEYMNRKHAGLITEADVEQIKNDLIKGVNSLDITKFENLYNSGDTSKDAISQKDSLAVLKEIALNSFTGSCHKDNINCRTNMTIDDILDDLVKRDVLEREREHYYQIKVGLFKEWLIAHK